ncbi:MAG: hypothetical protein ACYTBJ_06190 [Planctomycetota bacterium]|jgi:hypothetical protein
MAIGTMSQYTARIQWHPPKKAAGILPRRVNGTTLKPGMVVTATGETDPDVFIPDGNDDVSLGIALDRADKALDTAFADNIWIDVMTTRCGGGAWGFVDDDTGAIEPWTALYNTGADDDGFLEVLVVTAAPTTYDDSTIQGIIDYLEAAEHRYVGRAATYQADQGSTDVPLKVLMV